MTGIFKYINPQLLTQLLTKSTTLTTLTTLNLPKAGIEDDHIGQALVQGLSNNTTITTLNQPWTSPSCGYHSPEFMGVQYLAPILTQNKTITTLNLLHLPYYYSGTVAS